MSKVFRLHKSGRNTLNGWDISDAYDANAINEIQDPNGATCTKEITSIPSPFARMELVKSAFKVVADSGSIDGDTIYHKLVSDALDVGEIFFNIGKLKDKVRILVWDKDKDLQTLRDSSTAEHHLLGETLGLYLEQDKKAYNFKQLQRIYLLDYIGPGVPSSMNIIGATSPVTLFFTSANDLSYVSRNISFGKDRPFDSDFQPLYNRDFDYQVYWYCLQKAIPGFAKLFPEVETYLENSLKRLNDTQKAMIRELKDTDLCNRFDDLFVEADGDRVEVLGNWLMKKRPATDIQSDFKIKSTVCKEAKLPLVLPVTTYTENAQYVTARWDKDTKVPYNNPIPLTARTLPNDDTQYPYLTIGDFLEDYILLDRDALYKENFFNGFNGNPQEEKRNCYLLPLRRTFFNYFTPEELMGTMHDGRSMFELIPNSGGIKAVLRIPIQGNKYITYERLYFNDTQAEPENNKGGVIVRLFNVALLPNIKFQENVAIRYRVALLDQKREVNLEFYKGNEPVKELRKAERNTQDDNYTLNTAYVLNKEFDYIVLNWNNQYQGIILPRWKNPIPGNEQFTFAVDFGTTNTHIEYKDRTGTRKFEIGLKDIQLRRLNDWQGANRPLSHDYIPEVFGEGVDAHFPIRTVLSEGCTIDWDTAPSPMADTNVPFVYEKEDMSNYNRITTNLKWANDRNILMEKRVRHYLDALFLLMRNKVLLNGGRLDATKIIWFYPASMTKGRYNNFTTIWNDLYSKNFGGNTNNIIAMSESIAPYYYYSTTRGATENVVSIDIGGGTTDILIVTNREPQLLTSFRFAANSIFGDGYGFDADSNGFVQCFKQEIRNVLKRNRQDELVRILDKLVEKKDSTEIVSFFFSLADNKKLRNGNESIIDFNQKLRSNRKGIYVFLFFYMALIYHLARIMKAKGMPLPRRITFSGTGSKVLSVITSSTTTLEDFTKRIFEKVYNCQYDDNGLTIYRELENPKEATCKGGLSKPMPQGYKAIDELKQTLRGDTSDDFVTPNWSYVDAKNEDFLQSVVEEVKRFCKLFFQLNDELSYVNTFEADASVWSTIKQCCERDIMQYLNDGINKKEEEIRQSDTNVEETFFFYPLVGILNKMAQEVYK